MKLAEEKILSIVKGCKRGQGSSQRELFRLYAPKVMSMCRRYSSNNEMAKDVMQECFIQVFSSIDQYCEASGIFEGWLHTVSQRTIWRVVKRDWGEKTIYSEQTENTTFTVEPDAFAKLSNDEIIGEIQKLPIGYKTVLNMYVFESMSHKEIAEILGIEENSSRSQLARARQLLKRKIEAKNKTSYVKNTL